MNAIESIQYARVFDIIKQRRSVGQFTQDQPTRAQIERLLEAATYAPNHCVAEPWHFFVLTGDYIAVRPQHVYVCIFSYLLTVIRFFFLHN